MFSFFESRGGTLGEMHVFRVPHASESDGVSPQCISCLVGNCRWAKTNFAPSGRQFLLFCNEPYKNTNAYLKKTKNILDSSSQIGLKTSILDYEIKDNTSSFHPTYDIPEIRQETVRMSSNLGKYSSF